MMFRLLGMVAALDQRLHRLRINLVPLNYGLLLLLLGLSAGSVDTLVLRPSSPDPQVVSVASLAAGEVPAGTYVRVDGTVDSRYWIEITKRGVVDERILPLVDHAQGVGILISPSSQRNLAGLVRMTGMVRGLPKAAQDTLHRESATLPNRMNANLMLAAGQKPPSVLVAVLKLVVCAPLALALIYVRVKRNLIFRAGDRGESRLVDVGSHDEPIDLRMTGPLRLNDERPKRFCEVQAQSMVNDQGALVLGSDIDASSYVFGLCVRERIGFWSVVIPAGGVEEVTRGDLAFGSDVRPAASVRIGGPSPQTITLSFGAIEQRERFLRALVHHYGSGMRSAA